MSPAIHGPAAATLGAGQSIIHFHRSQGGRTVRFKELTDGDMSEAQRKVLDEASAFDVGYPYTFMSRIQGGW